MEEVKELTDTEQGTTETSDLRDDALADALAKAQAEESGEDTAGTLGGKVDGEAQTDTSEEGTVTEGVSEKGAETTTEEGTQETAQTEESELDKLRRTLAEKEKFAQRKATEAGELRKQILELRRAQLPQIDPTKWQEQFYENPQAAHEAVAKIEREKAEFQRQEAELYRKANEETITSIVPDFDSIKAEIVELAKADGTPPEYLANFEKDPFGTSDVQTLLSYAHRAKEVKRSKALEAELTTYKKKVESIASNIEKAAKSPSKITASTGKSEGVKEPLDESQIMSLPPEERNKLLDKLIEEEKTN